MQSAAELVAHGMREHQAGRVAAALEAYERVLAIDARQFDALHLRGVALHQCGRSDEAVQAIEAALTLRTHDAAALSNLGLALRALKRHDEALRAYDRAVESAPQFAQAWSNRGNLLRDMGRGAEAVASYERAVAANPQLASAWHGLGLALGDQSRWADSLQAFDRALALQADYAVAWMDRGNTLRSLERFEDALQSYERSLELAPETAFTWSNRGVVLKRLGRFAEAVVSYTRALTLKPDFVDAMVNFATLQKDRMDLESAIALNERALALQPDNSGAHLNLAICHLVTGNWDLGWPHYEWRWKTEQLLDGARNFAQAQWDGTASLQGQTILLHAEQGLGDTLQFCRLATLVAQRGARVVLEVQAPLKGLLAGLDGVAQVVARGEPLPPFDCHCPLLSLPLALGLTLDDLPVARAYVQPDASRVAAWPARLGAVAPKVGLVWSGRPEHKNDHNRSLPLATLVQALPAGPQYHCLQKEFRPLDAQLLQTLPQITRWDSALHDFRDTAALVAHMDWVVSVDTSVAHLAAAMGKPVWLLLPYSPDWRWIVGRDDSPWYPEMRLYRQPELGDWDSVLERLRHDIDTEFRRLHHA
ncbi:tetratricopeptide repeat protein [Curvibacter sp. APW13]|uniref:tetratricopeptide repeat protein n=1 Tax=Curvibacter sp. APW13 TaxID=3077236 RepID=UPI0028DE71E4|nr:tetratricopeptide repeat protein [Curvibacter sp. APW13]MDT8992897.1 tetratricopeptide repeat protein [Curvibacter sp. APW13]